MARFTMPSLGGAKGGSQRGSIREFVKKNPDFMKMDGAKRNQLLTELKMDSKKFDSLSRSIQSRNSGGGRAGGPSEKALSETAKNMIEKLIQKQLKKRQKEVVSIRACWFGNGRITKDGRIFDASNKQVGQIDPKTMQITIGWGSIGKYKDDSFTLTRLQRKLDSMGAAKKPATSAPTIGIGNFYGTASDSQTSWW